MDEDELRAALRTTMTLTPPPPMESGAALAAGHRAVRRRAAWAGASLTAVLVVATSVAAAVAPHPTGGPVTAASPRGVPAAPTSTGVPGTAATGVPGTATPGEGPPQHGAIARSGPRYQQGVRLLQRVSHAVPSGWTQPAGVTGSGLPLRQHEAQSDGPGWSYFASAAVSRGGATGRLLAEVHTPGNGRPALDPCSLAGTFWYMHGDCQVVTVGPAKVGVVVHAFGDERIDQWAAYRWPDGTVVYAAQSRHAVNGDSNLAPLTELPLTVPQLAALAADPELRPS